MSKYKRGQLVAYEVIGGPIICTVIKVGPRLMQIEMGDGTRRTVHPRSVEPFEDDAARPAPKHRTEQ
jgi:hypothetical protein